MPRDDAAGGHRLRTDPPRNPPYRAGWLWIRSKDATLTPQVLKRATASAAAAKRQREETGKAAHHRHDSRQQGSSTSVEAGFYRRVIHALAAR